MFLTFIAGTMGITYWAAKRTRTTSDFYTAGGGLTGFQNGLAIAGDYLSAASFLGIAGMVYVSGFDGMIYAIGFLFGWPVVMFLIAERLRNLGRYNFADVTSFRLAQTPMRVLAASASLLIIALYLIAQMVGAGKLIVLLFGLDYNIAVLIVGSLMMIYVAFGGMTATTWVQIIKAVLMLFGATLMTILVLAAFDYSPDALLAEATRVHPSGLELLAPGAQVSSNPLNALSLGIALAFGTAGLPHILMRFFTVSNAREARKSVIYASAFMLLLSAHVHHRLWRGCAAGSAPRVFRDGPGRRVRHDEKPDWRHQYGRGPLGQRRGRQSAAGFPGGRHLRHHRGGGGRSGAGGRRSHFA